MQLPDWFEVLNTHFRYELTVIRQFAQAIVASEIERGGAHNSFGFVRIGGDLAAAANPSKAFRPSR